MAEESATVVDQPEIDAKSAGLRYVSDDKPGIRRERRGDEFVYFDVHGRAIEDEKELKRIRSIGIPPAYENVWICPYANGHLQATGFDARGRKQYRYHPEWRRVRDENKYGRMMQFGKALPKIRARVAEDLAKPGLPREKVLATVVKLLEVSRIRVGNEEYAKTNHSFGLSTMRNRHVKVDGSRILFRFKGKSGKRHEIEVADRRIARVVAKCQELPGQHLFQYLDQNEEPVEVGSDEVNAYLQEITGEQFTAKDFRTWSGTVLAAMALQEFETVDGQAAAKKNVVAAIESVSKALGNTPAICRKCYVHPHIIEGYMEGTLVHELRELADAKIEHDLERLPPEEAAVLALLSKRLEKQETEAAPAAGNGKNAAAALEGKLVSLARKDRKKRGKTEGTGHQAA
ncbi:MAG: DNA topoisomerase IB [Verrucomicrobia bacterium]|nr:DNA topoisomerase IB [Verrucomicrobiota bacterium]